MSEARNPSQNQGEGKVVLGQEAIQIYRSRRLELAKKLLGDLGLTQDQEQAGKLDIQRLEQVIDAYWKFFPQMTRDIGSIFQLHYLHNSNTSFDFKNAPYPVKLDFIMFECVSDWIMAAGKIGGEGPEFDTMVDELYDLRNKTYDLISPLKQCNSWEECTVTVEGTEVSGVQAVGVILHKFREIAGGMIAVKEAYGEQVGDQDSTRAES